MSRTGKKKADGDGKAEVSGNGTDPAEVNSAPTEKDNIPDPSIDPERARELARKKVLLEALREKLALTEERLGLLDEKLMLVKTKLQQVEEAIKEKKVAKGRTEGTDDGDPEAGGKDEKDGTPDTEADTTG